MKRMREKQKRKRAEARRATDRIIKPNKTGGERRTNESKIKTRRNKK